MKESLLIILAAAVMLLTGARASAQVPLRDTYQAFDWNRDVVSFGFGPAARIHSITGKGTFATYGFQVSMDERIRYSEFFGFSAGIDYGTYRMYALPFSPLPSSTGTPAYTVDPETGYPSSGAPSLDDDRVEMYLEVPLRALLFIPFSRNIEMYVFGGFVPSLCLDSRSLVNGSYESDFGDDERRKDNSRVDVLGGGGLGVEIGERVCISMGYDVGLMNRNRGGIKVWQASTAKLTLSILF